MNAQTIDAISQLGVGTLIIVFVIAAMGFGLKLYLATKSPKPAALPVPMAIDVAALGKAIGEGIRDNTAHLSWDLVESQLQTLLEGQKHQDKELTTIKDRLNVELADIKTRLGVIEHALELKTATKRPRAP